MTRNKIVLIARGVGSAIATAIGLRRTSKSGNPLWPRIHFSWKGAWRTAMNLLDDMNTHNTGVLAGGMAYYASLAFFPTFAASLAIASIVISPEQAASAIESVNQYLPRDIAGLVSTQLETQTGRYGGNIAIAVVAIAISLFGASGAVENTIRSLNVVYGVKETRNIVKMRALSLALLLAALVVLAIVTSLLIVDEYMIDWGVPSWLVSVVDTARWPLLFIVMSFAFASLYRYGPNRSKAKWRWASWGAVVATLIWLVVTAGLFAYTRYFPSFSESYTLFAGIVVLMMWFNFSALALLIGGHINARIEHHTSIHLKKRV